MLEIYVDGDACPVKAEILRVAERHGLVVYLVSNRGFRPGGDPRVRNIVVPERVALEASPAGPRVEADQVNVSARQSALPATQPVRLRSIARDRYRRR